MGHTHTQYAPIMDTYRSFATNYSPIHLHPASFMPPRPCSLPASHFPVCLPFSYSSRDSVSPLLVAPLPSVLLPFSCTPPSLPPFYLYSTLTLYPPLHYLPTPSSFYLSMYLYVCEVMKLLLGIHTVLTLKSKSPCGLFYVTMGVLEKFYALLMCVCMSRGRS
jgi:hypothetical protein